ncbi:hypothetical protein O4106_21850 [Rhodococcus pyridinivorans]|uniref:hypothetical protein n=1 Tax=Rhodococcus pyridinivorans TaxID=103816 RepID=UPI0022B53D18|nr:hypothetical protein [Rhodococcus pyridinivorans]MCZ4649469.1 hypothetical protein [Rhodococcus pyridinivorans]
MPALTGSIKDAAGRPAKGAVRIKALHVREGTGGAVIDERTFDLPILNGTITGSPVLEPGPAKITLNVSGGRLRSWDVNIPSGTSIDLWDLIEQYIDYDPPVVSKVFEYMTRAEAAADRAESGGGGGGSLVEDPPGSGLYSPSSAGLTEDPSNPGLYLI